MGTLTYGGVVDVVVGGDHAQIERRHVHLVLHTDTLYKEIKQALNLQLL